MPHDYQHGFPGGPEHPPTGPIPAPVNIAEDVAVADTADGPSGTPWWRLRSSVAVPAVTAVVVGFAMWAILSWQNSISNSELYPEPVVTTTTEPETTEPTTPETTEPETTEPETTEPETTEPEEGDDSTETTAPADPDEVDDGLFAKASLDECAGVVNFEDAELQLSSGAATSATYDSLVSEGVGDPVWAASLPATLASAALGAAPTLVGVPAVGDDTTAEVLIPVGLDRTVIGRYDTNTAELLWGATITGNSIARSDTTVWFATFDADDSSTLVTALDTNAGDVAACYRSIGDSTPLIGGTPERVFVEPGDVAADADGMWVLWDGAIEYLNIDGSSQLADVGGDRALQLVAGADGVVVATVGVAGVVELVGFDAAAGSAEWRQPFSDVFASIPSSVTLSGQPSGGNVIISSALSDGQGWWLPETVAVSAADGEVVWSNTDAGVQVSRRIAVTGDVIQMIDRDIDMVGVGALDGTTSEVSGANAGLFVAVAGDRAVAYDLSNATVAGLDGNLATTNAAPVGTSGAHLLVVVASEDGSVSLLALPYDNPSAAATDPEGAPDV